MATHQDPSHRAREERAPRQARLPMTPSQLQAYLLARETLRRFKRSSSPCFARDPGARPKPSPGRDQPR